MDESISSILAQTRPCDELIVVDDGSDDRSGEIARSYGAHVVQLATNSGEGAARNAGLRNSTGDVIAWLDADDIWAPHHLETLTGLLDKYPEATAAFAAVQRFGLRDELIRGYVPLGEPSNVFWFAVKDWIHTTIGSMARRSALAQIGGFATDERYAVDYDLWLRLSRNNHFVCTHEVTSYWRWHHRQQSQNQRDQISAVYRFRWKYYSEELRSGDANVASRLGVAIKCAWSDDIRAALRQRNEDDVEWLAGLYKWVPLVTEHEKELARKRRYKQLARVLREALTADA